MNKKRPNRSILLDYLSFLTIIICLIFFGLKKISKEGKSQDVNQQTSSISEDDISKDGGICDVCGRKFLGRGYTEITSGFWQETKEPYQTFICSQPCGVRHTKNWNKTLKR